MHVKLPAALTLFSLLTTSAIAVPAANVERNNDGHPTTTTTSACAATSSAAVGGGVSGLLNDILTVGLAGTRPFLVYPPFVDPSIPNPFPNAESIILLTDDAIRAIAAQPTPTTSATPGAQTSISDSQTLCSYTIAPGQCVPVTYPPGTQEALEVAWEIVKYIFPFFFVATGETGPSAPLGTLNDTTVGQILSSASACGPGPTPTGFVW